MQALNSKNRKTLDQIFQEPPPSDIRFSDIETLMRALGVEKHERGKSSGSAVGFIYNKKKPDEKKCMVHKPHPQKVTDKGAINTIRGFLESIGVMP